MVVFWLLTQWCHGLVWFTSSPTLPTQQTPKSTTFPLPLGKTNRTRPDKTYLSLIKRKAPVYHVCFTCSPGKNNIEEQKGIELLQAKHLSKDPGRKRLFHLNQSSWKTPHSACVTQIVETLTQFSQPKQLGPGQPCFSKAEYCCVTVDQITFNAINSGEEKDINFIISKQLNHITEVWLRSNFPSVFTL